MLSCDSRAYSAKVPDLFGFSDYGKTENITLSQETLRNLLKKQRETAQREERIIYSRGAQPLAYRPDLAHRAMVSCPWCSPWVRKFGSSGVVAANTSTPPLLPNFQALHSQWVLSCYYVGLAVPTLHNASGPLAGSTLKMDMAPPVWPAM